MGLGGRRCVTLGDFLVRRESVGGVVQRVVPQPLLPITANQKTPLTDLISQKVIVESFCQRPFPHKSVNLSFIINNVENPLTNLCRN